MLSTYHDLSSLWRINPQQIFLSVSLMEYKHLQKEEIKKSREITLSTQHPAI